MICHGCVHFAFGMPHYAITNVSRDHIQTFKLYHYPGLTLTFEGMRSRGSVFTESKTLAARFNDAVPEHGY